MAPRFASFVLLTVCWASISIFGQEPAVIRAGTRLVQIDVTVRDKNGPVAGLKKDDFTLLDQGQKQEIALFNTSTSSIELSPNDAAKSVPPGASSNRTDPSGKPIAGATVLLLDELNTFFEKQGYARSELLKYLESAPEEDRVAVYMLGKELTVLRDFTDPAVAMQGVKKWAPGSLFVMLENAADQGATDNAVDDNPVYAQIRQQITTDAIQKIAEQLSRMPGRKNLVWISDRPGVAGVQFLMQSKIHLYPVLARAVGPSGVTGWLKDSRDARAAGADTPPPPAPSGDEMDREKANTALAAANGGVAFTDSRDISLAVKTAIEDTNDGYVLGFYPKEEKLDNKFHTLTVTVAKSGAARGKTLEIRYRPGYFAAKLEPPSAPQTARTRGTAPQALPKLTLDELLKDPLDISQVAVTAEPAPDPAHAGSFLVKVKIDPRDLALQDEDSMRSGLLDVSFYLQESGKLVTRTLKVAIPDDKFDDFVENGIQTVEPIDAAGAPATLRVVVEDQATGAVGSVTVPLGRR
jgi:VWFA-related protein